MTVLPALRIDVHSHFIPPFYREALVATGHSTPDGMPGIPSWSPEAHLQLMDSANISTSILSISSPGTCLWADASRCARLTRDTNVYALNLTRIYPSRFEYWASLPLPFVNESLAEIKRVVQEGVAQGFVLQTNYNGYYLGDPIFDEVLKLLDEEEAKIFIHPTSPCLRGSIIGSPATPATPLGGTFPNPMIEFLFDTARVMTNLLLRAVYTRFPRITTIYSHAAGAFPPLLSRIIAFPAALPAAAFGGEGIVTPLSEETARKILNTRCYFDLAGSPFPGQLTAFVAATGIDKSRLLYGSDFPFTPSASISPLAGIIDKGLGDLFGGEILRLVYETTPKGLLRKKSSPCSA